MDIWGNWGEFQRPQVSRWFPLFSWVFGLAIHVFVRTQKELTKIIKMRKKK